VDFDGVAGEQFVPIVLDLSAVRSLAAATVTFDYAGSDPDAVTAQGPAAGHLRIWTKDGDQLRVAADYVRPGVTHTAQSLGFPIDPAATAAQTTRTFYVEAVRPTDAAQGLVRVSVDVDGTGPGTAFVEDAALVTAEPSGATVGGYKWHDYNFNGRRETEFIVGGQPDVVYMIDVSGSTSELARDRNGNTIDLNGDGNPDSVLQAEVAAFIALNQSLIAGGLGDLADVADVADVAVVAVVAFGISDPTDGDDAKPLDLNPSTPALDLAIRPAADADGDGTLDLIEVLGTLTPSGGYAVRRRIARGEGDARSAEHPTRRGERRLPVRRPAQLV